MQVPRSGRGDLLPLHQVRHAAAAQEVCGARLLEVTYRFLIHIHTYIPASSIAMAAREWRAGWTDDGGELI